MARTLPAESPEFYGSAFLGLTVLHAPQQSQTFAGNRFSTEAATAPFIFGGGKFTYAPRGGFLGGQLDVHGGYISSGWINPNVGSDSHAYGYGATVHAFTRVIQDAKIGVFFNIDQYTIDVPGIRVNLPTYGGGLEGQYELTSSLLLRARAGLGTMSIKTNLDSTLGLNLPTIPYMTGGVGLTYRLDQNWAVGGDLNYTTASRSVLGIKGTVSALDVGAFAEYRFSSAPLSVRADVAWLRASADSNLTPSLGADALRAKLTLKYEFGGEPTRRRLVDSEFQSYAVQTGLR